MEKGIMYIATGEKYLREAKISANSVNINTNLGTAIISNRSVDSQLFDKTIHIDKPRKDSGDKIKNLLNTPFEKTLLLDTDTYICKDISEIFNILSKFDMAAPYAPNRTNSMTLSKVPEAIPEINTGVLLFRKNENVKGLVKEWWRRYKVQRKKGIKVDQPSFRESYYYGDVRLHVLPPEYNLRFGRKSVGYVGGEVKILHGRRSENTLKKFSKKINKVSVNRVWKIIGKKINIETHNLSLCERLKTGNISYKNIKTYIKR